MDDGPSANWSLTQASIGQPVSDSPANALELRGITKNFGAVTALDDVSLSIKPGSIHALLGENGAGKTTLMRIAFGMVKADSGQILRDGGLLELRSPADAIAARIGMVHQQFSLIPAMTVAENVALGGKGLYNVNDVAARISEIASTTGLTIDSRARVANLTSAERQKVEIVRTLAHDARILILDEPTAVLAEKDIGELFEQLRVFASAGGSVVLITHKLQNALDHADEVSVLRHGKLVLNAPMDAASKDSLTAAMLGSAPQEQGITRGTAIRSRLVARVGPPFVEVFAGEILGVAALEGAAGPLLRSFAGRAQTGSGKPGSGKTGLRVGFVPENRQEEALIPDLSLTENLALKNAGERRGIIDWKQLRDNTSTVIREFDVRASGPDATARSLSGGNQQRFVLGRELSDKPELLVLENPTQGLDVNAASVVHQRMKAARDSGTAIVFYSTDLDELVDLADRVVVVGGGRISDSPPDKSEIGRLLLGIETAEHPVA
ncbi:MAG: ATP-binding cassette domain-containing protein [Gemmatimonadales bacterium]